VEIDMSKGSTQRPLTDREIFETNFDKIFGKKKHYQLDDGQLTDEQYAKIKEYEYQLNPSTGEVEKLFKDGC